MTQTTDKSAETLARDIHAAAYSYLKPESIDAEEREWWIERVLPVINRFLTAEGPQPTHAFVYSPGSTTCAAYQCFKSASHPIHAQTVRPAEWEACGNEVPGPKPAITCALIAGHAGAHSDGRGCVWENAYQPPVRPAETPETRNREPHCWGDCGEPLEEWTLRICPKGHEWLSKPRPTIGYVYESVAESGPTFPRTVRKVPLVPTEGAPASEGIPHIFDPARCFPSAKDDPEWHIQPPAPAPVEAPRGEALTLAPTYAEALMRARVAAKGYGYAIALHGSGTRDLDLVAIPWIENACAPEYLMLAVKSAVKGYVAENKDKVLVPTVMPHGRLQWSIHLGGGPYIDLSVTPWTAPAPSPETPTAPTCPNGLLPDGETCPRCGKLRLPSGIDGGTWAHAPEAPKPAPAPEAKERE